MKRSLILGLSISILAAGFTVPAELRAINIRSADIVPADGTSDQILTSGTGVKTDHIQNGAVTNAKITGPIDASKINSIGLDADTLDGQHAMDFASGTHDHDSAYQKKYANVLVVAKSGGEFTDPIAALNSITNASASNQYLVRVMPGTYDLADGQSMQMKAYVDVEGSGKETTRIRSLASWLPGGVVVGVANAALRNLSVDGTGAATGSVLLNPSLVENVSIAGPPNQVCVHSSYASYGSVIRDANLTTCWVGFFADHVQGTTILERVNVVTDGIGIEFNMSTGFVKDVRIVNNSEAAIYLNGGSVTVQDASIDANGTWGGIYSGSGASHVLKNIDLSFTSGYGIHGFGTGRLEVLDSRLTAEADGAPGIVVTDEQVGTLSNVSVNTGEAGTSPALRVSGNASLGVFNGRHIGDALVESPTSTFKAAGSLFTGSLPNQGTVKLINCFDGGLTPIPNQ